MADWTTVLPIDDLPLAKSTVVTLDETKVLLYRTEERIYAIGNRCTHQGAPLDRGVVKPGADPTVTCPAHGSMFRLADGRVMRPPAGSPVASFEAQGHRRHGRAPPRLTLSPDRGPPGRPIHLPTMQADRGGPQHDGASVFRKQRAVTDDQVRRDARVAGLREFQTPSLEAVEQRRRQLWQRTATGLAAVAFLVVVLSFIPDRQAALLGAGRAQIGVLVVAGLFFLWAFEKESALERLTRSLTNERVLTAALTNRLHEVSLLLDAGKQMNAVLELNELLDTILRSACELLDATGGSVMLVEETDLVTKAVIGRVVPPGHRVRLGDGVAGHVALRREPVLIEGQADAESFPGLTEREHYVDSSMSAPLVHRAELQGVLNVNAPLGRSFTEYDLRALAVFAEQAALAIANARLYEAERAHVAALLQLRPRREAG